MDDTFALFEALRRAVPSDVADAVAEFVRTSPDERLARVNALALSAETGLDEDVLIGALLHTSRLGLFEMSWNILCPHCRSVLAANATLRSVRRSHHFCAFCDATEELRLDDRVEVTFTVSPRLRRIGAHDPDGLGFWDYHRQVFFGSGVDFPERATFDALASSCVLETVELQGGERLLLTLPAPEGTLIAFDPVTHTAQYLTVEGPPAGGRQDLAMVFDGRPSVARATLPPGMLRLSLDNRTRERVLLGIYRAGPELDALIGGQRPFLTARRLLSNQTFRDVFRTDTLDIDQRLKITSLTFLFTDLQGSTELYERVGDFTAYDLVRTHFRLLHDIVAAESGAVVKTIGDAVMATFDRPERALAAALRMQAAMRELNTERGAEDLKLKIGLHEGPCLAVSLNDRQDYFGQTVNIASRVQDLASRDAIFATGSILGHRKVEDLLRVSGLAGQAWTGGLRGIGDRIPVYRLTPV
ncbi:adenylate/guanylate cyclase domain-containing protein [Methylobacterium mesophilicum SR1.6/6]|uniref:Adenylate/guanylate cyclase domain-containing protein n=1 Tax=Methylobacterium mesophilicum SR1.6/6 TaxID=908290 RepID=A0A6B9FLA2_9HYPH|nr:adenylate/guanylate cyclase domain-containing protein [Methylobacterium mesophilicum]QGY01905.1 adenylate/guanylate cyclase domain-containing protein [Methylobacterium mesophilicum SR1.6/6]